jgi:ADP-ribose pyrophosphatase YjhB (NUDIX family)
VDVSVAGHLAAGESTEAALREAREEIGLALHASDLLRLGTRRREDIGDGRADREVQELFFAVAASGLECLMPDPDEVMGLLTVPLPDALALVRGEREATAARELHRGGEAVVAVELRRGELLLSPDGYFEAALDAISRRLAGDLSAGLAKTSG